jgi:hypothetical protein
MKAIKCWKCKSEILKMYLCECGACKYNGVWDECEREYIYPEKLKDGQIRTQADDECCCELGDTMGNGCWLYECAECGAVIDIIYSE